jgi:hypothetical protein
MEPCHRERERERIVGHQTKRIYVVVYLLDTMKCSIVAFSRKQCCHNIILYGIITVTFLKQVRLFSRANQFETGKLLSFNALHD